jgi:pyridinium-3,5-bisthiocarboxylic acid mononucleotide nickel chelatase
MRILYFDCFSGISGNMVLGAFLDLGIDAAWLQAELSRLPLHGYHVDIARVTKRGIAAHHVDVRIPHEHHHRHLADIRCIINNAPLPEQVKTLAQTIFVELAAAEAKVHNCDINDIHFHEVGAVDAIIDIVGAALCVEKLNIDKVYSSPLHVGSGTVRCAHGVMPVPAPATAELLIGMPIYSTDIQGELVTPTGAAILKALEPAFGALPVYTPLATGYGAGSKELAISNVLRVILGETSALPIDIDLLDVLECNIDNLNPEIYDYVMDKLFAAGALDVTLSPLLMKKNRPGTLLKVLCSPEHTSTMQQIIFTETTSLGIRVYTVKRPKLERQHITVSTPHGSVRLKISGSQGRIYTVAPEHEDCKNLALESGLPLKSVYDAALTAYYNKQ